MDSLTERERELTRHISMQSVKWMDIDKESSRQSVTLGPLDLQTCMLTSLLYLRSYVL